jgi:hypothetical protein
MKMLARLMLLIPALPSVAGLLLSTTVAVAQDTQTAAPAAVAPGAPPDRRNRCKLLTAKRGESAEVVPEEDLRPGRAAAFPYAFDDSNLREDFRVDEDRRRGCLAIFGIQQAASSAAGGAGAAGAAAAAPGGVAAVGAGIGVGTISAGTIALGGLGLIVTAGAIGVATAGGNSGGPGAPTNTTIVAGAPGAQ